MSHTIQTLENGVRIIVLHQPHLQSVLVKSFVKTGSFNETPIQNGISHFLEHMAFKGTPNRTAQEINSEMEFLGGSINAGTSTERTMYHVTGHKKDLAEFVDFVTDITVNPTFPDDELETERAIIVQEYHGYEDDPGSVVYNLINKLAYPDQAVGRKVIGELDTIQGITQDMLRDYHKSQYTGRNIIIGVVGNFPEPQSVIDLIAERVKHIPAGVENDYEAGVYVGGVGFEEADVQQNKIRIMFPASPNANVRDHLIEGIAISALCSGFSSPMFNEIREKAGLAYWIGGGSIVSRKNGGFHVSCDTTPENIPPLFEKLEDLLLNHRSFITAKDIQRAKNGDLVYISTVTDRGARLLSSHAVDLFNEGKIIPQEVYQKIIEDATDEEVYQAMDRLITANPTVGIVGKPVDMAVAEKFASVFAARAAV